MTTPAIIFDASFGPVARTGRYHTRGDAGLALGCVAYGFFYVTVFASLVGLPVALVFHLLGV